MAEIIDILLALLALTGIITIGLLVVDDMSDRYGVVPVQEFNKTNLDLTDRINSLVSSGSEKIQNKSTTDTNAASESLVGAFGTYRLMFELPSLAGDIIRTIGAIFGINPLIFTLVTTAILAIITFAIARAIFRVQ